MPIGWSRKTFHYNDSFARSPPESGGSEPMWDSLIPSKPSSLYLSHPDLSIEDRWAWVHQASNASPEPFGHQRFPPASLSGKLYIICHPQNSTHIQQYTLRRAYYSISEPHELEDFDFGINRTLHTSHCFEYLRQSLMCSADSSIEPAARVDGFLGWGFQRQCRNFVELKSWAENSRAFEGHGFLAAEIMHEHSPNS